MLAIRADEGIVHVEAATTWWRRLRGIAGVAAGRGVIIGGGAVHSRWMRTPLRVLAFDRTGVVVADVVLEPGLRLEVPGAAMVLEIPLHVPLVVSTGSIPAVGRVRS